MIVENIVQVRSMIEAACARAGRTSESVTLIAVSKTHPADYVLAAIAAGVQHFGENRVEESTIKIPAVTVAFDTPLIWHMIGHIQSRKAKEVAHLFQVVHSVDSLKLAAKLAAAVEGEHPIGVYLEINVSGEESKSGFAAHGWEHDRSMRTRLVEEIRQITAMPRVVIRGLMTMAPIVEDMEATRPVFAGLRELRDALRADIGVELPELSMGMTDDYPIAIQEGATCIRVGRAIFGDRRTMDKT